jgi:hypothetical protein
MRDDDVSLRDRQGGGAAIERLPTFRELLTYARPYSYQESAAQAAVIRPFPAPAASSS